MFPSELAVVKSRLEAEGITCKVLDELTAQSHNFLSQAMGGVRLQVHISDVERAYRLLLEEGFLTDHQESNSTDLTNNFEESNVGNYFKRFIWIIIGASMLLIITCIALVIFNRPSDMEKLVKNTWCMDYLEYKNETYYPQTVRNNDIPLRLNIGCEEKMIFTNKNLVQIPGFGTPSLKRIYKIENEHIILTPRDSFTTFFDGAYKYELSNSQLILTSDSIRMVCYNPYK